jgi:hypothetical protein
MAMPVCALLAMVILPGCATGGAAHQAADDLRPYDEYHLAQPSEAEWKGYIEDEVALAATRPPPPACVAHPTPNCLLRFAEALAVNKARRWNSDEALREIARGWREIGNAAEAERVSRIAASFGPPPLGERPVSRPPNFTPIQRLASRPETETEACIDWARLILEDGSAASHAERVAYWAAIAGLDVSGLTSRDDIYGEKARFGYLKGLIKAGKAETAAGLAPQWLPRDNSVDGFVGILAVAAPDLAQGLEKLFPEDAGRQRQLWIQIGRAFAGQARPAQADQAFRRAAAVDPSPERHAVLQAALHAGRLDLARSLVDRGQWTSRDWSIASGELVEAGRLSDALLAALEVEAPQRNAALLPVILAAAQSNHQSIVNDAVSRLQALPAEAARQATGTDHAALAIMGLADRLVRRHEKVRAERLIQTAGVAGIDVRMARMRLANPSGWAPQEPVDWAGAAPNRLLSRYSVNIVDIQAQNSAVRRVLQADLHRALDLAMAADLEERIGPIEARQYPVPVRDAPAYSPEFAPLWGLLIEAPLIGRPGAVLGIAQRIGYPAWVLVQYAVTLSGKPQRVPTGFTGGGYTHCDGAYIVS